MNICNTTFRRLLESIDCNKLNKHFIFSGTAEENKKGLNLTKELLKTDCESLIDLKHCLNLLITNFCKSKFVNN